MDKQDVSLLEQAFANEVTSTLQGLPRLVQTKEVKRANALVAKGLLSKSVEVWRGVRIEGYKLTDAGHYAYCSTCDSEDI